jgi:FkbM family methyltransferase
MTSLWRRAMTGNHASPLRRAGALLLSRTHITAWATLHTKQKLKVDLSSSVGRSIWFRGSYEPEVENLMRLLLKPGDVFVDVGSNVGYFSVIGAQIVARQGEIHAFEPDRKICGYLNESVAANSLNNLFVNETALWRQPGTLSFAAQRDSGFSHLDPKDIQRGSMAPVLVQAQTLDRYIESSVKRPVKLLKIDVEGAEYDVLLGMIETLQSQSPFLIVETVDWSLARFGRTVEQLFSLLCEQNYKAYDLDGQPLAGAPEAQECLRNSWVKNLLFAKTSPPKAGAG